MSRFVVESPIFHTSPSGEQRQGTARLYVDTEERAREVAGGAPDRTWRALPEPEPHTTH